MLPGKTKPKLKMPKTMVKQFGYKPKSLKKRTGKFVSHKQATAASDMFTVMCAINAQKRINKTINVLLCKCGKKHFY